MKNGFLLSNDVGRELYSYAKQLPIIDYHNHLPLADISGNTRFINIYDLWIKPDPYKHRVMRMCGVPERLITQDCDKKEKFGAWCSIFPKLVGNQIYHWSRMELENIFGITQIPSAENAGYIYDKCNDYLLNTELTPKTLLDKYNVKYASPCASVTDDVSFYKNSKLFSPSLRGDDIVAPTPEFVKKLEFSSGFIIKDINTFERALESRFDEFQSAGCCFSDHALDNGFSFYPDDGKNGERFRLMLDGTLSGTEKERLSSYILLMMGRKYAARGIVMQLHMGAQRYTSTRLRTLAGAAGGFAGIGNSVNSVALTSFLDALDMAEHGLPKTVLFTLNPADNELISVLSGSYSKDGVSGLVTQGPAWWWCDHSQAIVDVLESTAAYGLLYNFVGMTTDSRSFLSFERHDYFRRILCNFLGNKAQMGLLPNNTDELKKLVYAMCYGNAQNLIKKENEYEL